MFFLMHHLAQGVLNLDNVEWDYNFYQKWEDNSYQKWEEKEWEEEEWLPKSVEKWKEAPEPKGKMDLLQTIKWTDFGES